MKNSNVVLVVAGALSFCVALFQAAISFVPAWSAALGAGEALVSDPALLLVAGLGMALVFALCGLYALSGAGLLRRLPLLRLGLVTIGAVYTLRGVSFVPLFLMILGVLPTPYPVPTSALLSSLVALVIGILYLAGLLIGWKTLKGRLTTPGTGIASRPGLERLQ